MDKNQQAILEGLRALYPNPRPELDFSNPYETLVATILAAQCTDQRVNQVTPAVFRDFPDANAMAKTTPEILYPYVKSCGFTSKAKNIVAACKIIAEKHGGKVPDTLEELTALPGVGRKTANVVLSVAFGQPRIAVDTHVFRLANRIGLAQEPDVLKTELALMKLLPDEHWIRLHHALIWHGRQVCTSRNPKCGVCGIADLCRKNGLK